MSENQTCLLGSVVLVCQNASSSAFSDDLQESCADCGCGLSVRPYLAEENPKVCVACFSARRDSAQLQSSRPEC
jgi:hypothetical protein